MEDLDVRQIAKMIDHSLLHPTMNDHQLRSGCELAARYDVASVCIKPYAVSDAVAWLVNSDVAVGTVVGFPQGGNNTQIKIDETKIALNDGAKEIDMVVNIGKVLSREWGYVQDEIGVIVSEVRSHGGILKVIFENDFLPEDEYKIRLCEICTEERVDFVKTSTGYGMVKTAGGMYSYAGATIMDLKLMRKYAGPQVQVKAAGGVRTLDDVLQVISLGVTRVGATATAMILDEAAKRFLKITGRQAPADEPPGY
jgi:deoxyribose-phosphate aldolase